MREVSTGPVARVAAAVQQNVGKVIVGKESVVEAMLVAVLCEGHILIEDVPGVGKTMLARSIAKSLGCTFRRVQCTPDLLPSDITGTSIFDQRTAEFHFRPGPLFAQIVLADEVNRATPRTQSALLEAMEERQVTADGETRALPRPFLVLATENPVELEGTFPLPEAQLDRFLMRVRIGYPTKQDDDAILLRFTEQNPLDNLQQVTTADELLELQQACRRVQVRPEVRKYIIDIIHATRAHAHVEVGASPRAMLGLSNAAQALAAIHGRDYVIPDDVKQLASSTLEHRLIFKAQSYLRERTKNVINEVIASVPVPVEEHGMDRQARR